MFLIVLKINFYIYDLKRTPIQFGEKTLNDYWVNFLSQWRNTKDVLSTVILKLILFWPVTYTITTVGVWTTFQNKNF